MSMAEIADNFFGLFNYWVVVILMVAGLYTVISKGHLIKKIIGLNIFQVSVFMMYITMGKVEDGTAPIFSETAVAYSNPLNSVLILTAIVVGVATTAVGLALAVRIYEAYGTLDESEIIEMDGGE